MSPFTANGENFIIYPPPSVKCDNDEWGSSDAHPPPPRPQLRSLLGIAEVSSSSRLKTGRGAFLTLKKVPHWILINLRHPHIDLHP